MAKYFGSNGVSQVDITGTRTGASNTLKRGRDGFFTTDSKMAAKALLQAGFAEASLMGVPDSGVGYLCSGCGFNGFFAMCSRCGTNNKIVSADETKVITDDCGCDDCDCKDAE
jgi:hypothetical protein